MDNQRQAWSTKTVQMENNIEAICQCHNFHYISKAEMMFNVRLNNTLSDFFEQRALQEPIISQEEVLNQSLQIMSLFFRKQPLHLQHGVLP